MSAVSHMALLIRSAAASITYLGSDSSTGGSPVTFSGKTFGAAATNRYIAVAVGAHNSSAVSVTVDGNAATSVVTVTNSTYRASIFIVALPTGTSGNIVVTASGTSFTHISWYALQMSSGTAHATNTDTDPAVPGSSITLTNTLNIPAGGVALAVVTSSNSASASATWSGLTENVDTQAASFQYYTAASGAFASAQTGLPISALLTNANVPAMVMASFGP